MRTSRLCVYETMSVFFTTRSCVPTFSSFNVLAEVKFGSTGIWVAMTAMTRYVLALQTANATLMCLLYSLQGGDHFGNFFERCR